METAGKTGLFRKREKRNRIRRKHGNFFLCERKEKGKERKKMVRSGLLFDVDTKADRVLILDEDGHTSEYPGISIEVSRAIDEKRIQIGTIVRIQKKDVVGS